MILSSPLRKAAAATTTTDSSERSSKRPRSVSPERQQPRKRPQLVLGRTHSFQQQRSTNQQPSSSFPSMFAVRSSLSMAIAAAVPPDHDTVMALDRQEGSSLGSPSKSTCTDTSTSTGRRIPFPVTQLSADGPACDLAMSLSMLVDEAQDASRAQFCTPPPSPTKHAFYTHTPANSSSSDISPDTPRRFDHTSPTVSQHHVFQQEGNRADNPLQYHSAYQTPRKMALPPSPTRKKFRMGYKKGCIDCETRVAGHHSHIEYDYN